jgi:hypothetical protein
VIAPRMMVPIKQKSIAAHEGIPKIYLSFLVVPYQRQQAVCPQTRNSY